MTEQPSTPPPDYGPGLRIIRRRRWYLWLEILVYVPLMWLILKVAPSNLAIGAVFVVWFIMLWIVVGVSALARCPRCGNYFHMNGMTLLYFRKCLHCQLHLTADRRKG